MSSTGSLRKFRAHAIDRGNERKRKRQVDTQIVTEPLALVDRFLDLGSIGGYSLEERQHPVQT